MSARVIAGKGSSRSKQFFRQAHPHFGIFLLSPRHLEQFPAYLCVPHRPVERRMPQPVSFPTPAQCSSAEQVVMQIEPPFDVATVLRTTGCSC
jgi:hypothetical protein